MKNFTGAGGIAFSSECQEWETPIDLFKELDKKYHFTLDPCSTDQNAKCKKHYTKRDNGLKKSWQGETVFCNPPYGRDIKDWVEKCYEESRHAKVVMLIPARTDTRWFHEYIYKKAEIIFLKGRIKFTVGGVEKHPAPFPSMLVIYDRRK